MTHSRHTILVVDDSEATLAPLGRLLQLSGYNVRLARNAAEAIAAVGAPGVVDLMISDLGLPDRSGVELMRDVKAQFGLRGIAMTGYTGDQTARDCTSAGFDRHFSKPILFADLCAALHEMLP